MKRVMGCAESGAGTPCRPYQTLWWSSQWGHETCEACASRIGCGYATRTLPVSFSVEVPIGPRNM
eukprot:1268748-Pyramimonas_sp.AAC.1